MVWVRLEKDSIGRICHLANVSSLVAGYVFPVAAGGSPACGCALPHSKRLVGQPLPAACSCPSAVHLGHSIAAALAPSVWLVCPSRRVPGAPRPLPPTPFERLPRPDLGVRGVDGS